MSFFVDVSFLNLLELSQIYSHARIKILGEQRNLHILSGAHKNKGVGAGNGGNPL